MMTAINLLKLIYENGAGNFLEYQIGRLQIKDVASHVQQRFPIAIFKYS